MTVDPRVRKGTLPAVLLSLEARLELVPTAPWVACPAALLLTSGGRGFDVRVDPTVHFFF